MPRSSMISSGTVANNSMCCLREPSMVARFAGDSFAIAATEVAKLRRDPTEILTRASPWLGDAARRAVRLPSGHPEGFIEAFANVYRGIFADIRARRAGVTADPLDADYPTVADGARGVHFIERAVASSAERRWL